MPDKEGKQSGPGIKDTPDQAYKSGRSEDIQEGSLGADTGGAGVQKSRLPEGSDEAGSSQSGGFAGQEADDSPDAGTVGAMSGEGDASPHADSGENETPSASDDVNRMENLPITYLDTVARHDPHIAIGATEHIAQAILDIAIAARNAYCQVLWIAAIATAVVWVALTWVAEHRHPAIRVIHRSAAARIGQTTSTSSP